jgi:hypothetical protein
MEERRVFIDGQNFDHPGNQTVHHLAMDEYYDIARAGKHARKKVL